VQNSQVTVGQIGRTPSTDTQMINATITAQRLLTTVDEFEDILLKVNEHGSKVRLKDLAKVELSRQKSS
ncbi:efflux RND transporter permease subunit, partial [Psychromonas aquatilis]